MSQKKNISKEERRAAQLAAAQAANAARREAAKQEAAKKEAELAAAAPSTASEEKVETPTAPIASEEVKEQEAVTAVEQQDLSASETEVIEAVVEEAPAEEVHPDIPYLKDILDKYAYEMAPGKPHAPGVGARMQMSLYRAFNFLFTRRGDAFFACADYLSAFFHTHKDTLFDARCASRYVNDMTIGEKKREMFVRLVYLFTTLSDRASRVLAQRSKTIDINKAIEGVESPEAVALLQDYFSPRI